MVKIESTEDEILGLQVLSMIQAQVNPGSYISHNANKPNVFAPCDMSFQMTDVSIHPPHSNNKCSLII